MVNRPTGSPRREITRDVAFWKVVAAVSLVLASVLYSGDPLGLFSFSSEPICTLVSASRGIELAGASGPHDGFATNDRDTGKLFGLDTELVTEGPLLEKWLRIEAGITKDLEIIAQCRASKPCPAPAQKLIDLSLEGVNRSERARVGLINRAVDLAISPMSDERQWGVSDHWSDPLETLSSNAGDCEDYAIVKYAALLTAGVPKDALKIVVWRQRLPNEDHAVVAARVDNQWVILDNRTLVLVRDTDVTRATPKFVLDHRGVRRFVGNGRNTRTADAAARQAIAWIAERQPSLVVG
jgi:predicted transglutaminase-like cysteine proteinase